MLAHFIRFLVALAVAILMPSILALANGRWQASAHLATGGSVGETLPCEALAAPIPASIAVAANDCIAPAPPKLAE